MRSYQSFRFLTLIIALLASISAFSQETNCGNGIDDDNDGYIDCADSECADSGSCEDAFTCDNTLYQVISASLKKLDPLTGQYELIGNASSSYNGAGYNVQDGYIYGVKSISSQVHLWRINARGKELDLGPIANYTGRTYVGDFDENGNLYTYNSGTNPTLNYIDVNANELKVVQQQLGTVSGASIPGVADLTYNPVFKKFYGLSGVQELIELDHIGLTARILGKYSSSIDVGGGFGAAWSDQDGNSYFSNNGTGKIFRFSFEADGSVASITYVATGEKTNSNDGMGCFYSLPPFETDCTDGIDNDGDGLTDCADPDCANSGICPAVNAKLRSIDKAGPMSIVPFHLQLVNSSNADALDFSIVNLLPAGFSFLSDTLEYSAQASAPSLISPMEDQRDSLSWVGLNLPIGDTITISFSLLVDLDVQDGFYNFDYKSLDVIQSPYRLEHILEIDQEVYASPLAYQCEPAFYQVYKKRGEPNILGKLNPTKGEYDLISVIDHQANGLGYDVHSGYAYGADGKKFIQIDQEGHVTYLGLELEKKVFVGDADTLGYWYGKVGNDIVRVDLNTIEINAQYSGQGLPGWDMAYNKDGHFYAMHGKQLYRFNTSTNLKETLGAVNGATVPNSGHGAQWTGIDGYHYISNNITGQIYRININTMTATLSMVTESNLQFNDGFACPTELPIVFGYDYGDYNLFPIARQLVYSQDIGEDDKSDYNAVWLGDGISDELLDPSNKTATGDTRDDGFRMQSSMEPGEVNNVQLILSSNQESADAYWGMWIDWDNNGNYEEYFSGHETINQSKTIEVGITMPFDYTGERYAIRVRTSVKPIFEANFSGDVTEPGEVEDYIFSGDNSELCSNGIDDDNNGLVDCDDPSCVDSCSYGEPGSGGEGGLESNDNLLGQITQTLYQRKREGNTNSINNLRRFQRTNYRIIPTLDLESLIPVDIIEGTQTLISSPQHLIDITNAVDLFSVDIYEGDKRVAAVLTMETVDKVYEHTKYICDRLTGSQIVDILSYKIDGTHDFIVTKLELPDGTFEYACSFGLRKMDPSSVILESHWNLTDYPASDSYFNFQVWANNTRNLFELVNEILQLTKDRATIGEYNLSSAPEVFVKSGKMSNNRLTLDIVNKLGVEYLNVVGSYSKTETMGAEVYDEKLLLTGELYQTVTLDINDPYYIGLAFYHPEALIEDVIFMANGAWGHDSQNDNDKVNFYEVSPTSHSEADSYNLQRAIEVTGEVTNYISFYRSFSPRFNPEDLDDYNSLKFRGRGTATLEISVLKEGIIDWSEQSKTIITLTPDKKDYVLGKEFFLNNSGTWNTWEDANMIVINVLGDGQESIPFDMELSDFSFSDKSGSTPYIIHSNYNIITPQDQLHIVSKVDGTDMGEVEINAGFSQAPLSVTIDNIGALSILVDEVAIIDTSGAFSINNFEPRELTAGEELTFEIVYRPKQLPQKSDAIIQVYIETTTGYELRSFNISATGICVDSDTVSTEHLKGRVGSHEIKARNTIYSDGYISSKQILTFSAGQEISLQPGFEIDSNASLTILAEDRCNSQN